VREPGFNFDVAAGQQHTPHDICPQDSSPGFKPQVSNGFFDHPAIADGRGTRTVWEIKLVVGGMKDCSIVAGRISGERYGI
jgi:hypothetical protein